MKEVNMKDKSVFCGNKNLEQKYVQYIYKHDSKFMIVNDVPSKVCAFCGEQYFEGKDLENIEKLFFDIINNRKQVNKKIEVPVFDFEVC